MDSYSEVRRVREKLSQEAGHDIRRLIASINQGREAVSSRIVDPGTAAESCGKVAPLEQTPFSDSASSQAP